jgi:hypothetical protein
VLFRWRKRGKRMTRFLVMKKSVKFPSWATYRQVRLDVGVSTFSLGFEPRLSSFNSKKPFL